jgi:hypothetical protein
MMVVRGLILKKPFVVLCGAVALLVLLTWQGPAFACPA